MADNGDDDSHCRIKEGDYVVLKRGDIFKAAQIQLKKKVIFEKQWIYLDNAVGHFYRTTFEIGSGGTLLLKTPKEMESSTAAKEAGADNRNIVDDGKSQKLTRDDIEMLKEQGLKGQEIIQQLIDNSSTFKDKTEYAQDKYIKKKKKKYENTVTILKPSCRILAMMYHGREPGKICHLRHDTLAQMLTLANIHAGSKVLVFETCSGLVLGAVMERMGGFGSVIQMYPGGEPLRPGVDYFGFPSHFRDMLHEFPICHVNALLTGTLNTKTKDPSIDSEKSVLTAKDVQQDKADVKQQGSPEEQSREASSVANTSDDQEKEDREKRKEAKAQERKAKLEEKRKKMAAAAALLDGRNADGLVIAGRFHPCPVLLGLLKFLAPSRPFVVYSQHKEPLIECYTKLKEVGGTVSLRLTDTWLRHYQVMPNRTHPLLLMSGGGGYLLSGTTVAVDHSKPAGSLRAEEPAPKRLKLTNTEG
ncbi:tRNA (adenine(58)-N(1))-methyltransferase non-catalytic subunit TRM6 [Takifugu rubripes]|uniref:tRNA (adenine(58)-N(1))-methyltransferase non-catalytic subunit TRM6 n=1 Tax=Takifugu rubripes TaxID=31033 RepID=A0A674PDM5_TAKRU|nr:tRNA (adenine(58)-N(1))-methyltransferase non-catalytic subunit TRM6 [Takifugu rubripes]|eukprot:XP_003971633.1 PREDICTED: LOW QUALITY PROTEIN: tRNA (adenine(58)-N(1))-methyltransferase non-catalytic subunit TRM6 [Takifugu rubripes]